MNNKSYTAYFIVLLLLYFTEVFSQQFPHYTQYRYNMNVINPAYAGSKKTFKINMLGRSQWVGVEGAPRTGTLVLDSPINDKTGVGFSAIYDQVGPLKETYLYGDISHAIRVSSSGTLAFGLKVGVSFQNIDTSLIQFNVPEGVDDLNNTSPNLGFGMYYYEEKYYIGLSAPNVLSQNINQFDNNGISENSSGNDFYLASGYLFDLSSKLILKPSVLLRYSTVFPVSIDFSAALFFNEKVELGLSYRTNNTVSLTSLFQVKDTFRLGYAYDYSTGGFSNNNGSHEIIVLFDLNTKIKNRHARRHTCF